VVVVTALAACVSACAARAVDSLGSEEVCRLLEEPKELGAQLAPEMLTMLAEHGITADEVSKQVRDYPYTLLRSAFDPADLPDTPVDWTPIPEVRATLVLRVAIVLVSHITGMETISYGSENDGALFVNLVALEGKGAMAEKSTSQMKGHTDAATFPFRGTNDPSDPRIAPSPDVVFLAALRNPDDVATMINPLHGILGGLTKSQIDVLKGERVTLVAQRSFRKGTAAILGDEHILNYVNVLHDSDEGTWVRYSHSNSIVDDDDTDAVLAKARFEESCKLCAQALVLKPGDLLVVNNRKALHGRSDVGAGVGGQTRWLIRSYGLDTSDLEQDQRYENPPHQLFP
jgi:L-asparagine oxygenase